MILQIVPNTRKRYLDGNAQRLQHGAIANPTHLKDMRGLDSAIDSKNGVAQGSLLMSY